LHEHEIYPFKVAANRLNCGQFLKVNLIPGFCFGFSFLLYPFAFFVSTGFLEVKIIRMTNDEHNSHTHDARTRLFAFLSVHPSAFILFGDTQFLSFLLQPAKRQYKQNKN